MATLRPLQFGSPLESAFNTLNQSLKLAQTFKELKNANKPTYQIVNGRVVRLDKNTGRATVVQDLMTSGANFSTIKSDIDSVAEAILRNRGISSFVNEKGKYDPKIAYGFLLNTPELSGVLGSPRMRPFSNQIKLLLNKSALNFPKKNSEFLFDNLDKVIKQNNIFKQQIDLYQLNIDNQEKKIKKLEGYNDDKIFRLYGESQNPIQAYLAELESEKRALDTLRNDPNYANSIYRYTLGLNSITKNYKDILNDSGLYDYNYKPITDYLSVSMDDSEKKSINESINEFASQIKSKKSNQKDDANIKKDTKFGDDVLLKSFDDIDTNDINKIFPNIIGTMYVGDEDAKAYKKFTNTMRQLGQGILPQFQGAKDNQFVGNTTQEAITGQKSTIGEPLMNIILPDSDTAMTPRKNKPVGQFDLVKFIDDSVESPINKEMLSGMIDDSVLGNSDAYIKNILTGFGAPDSIINNFNNKK
jgi:hypothetical protein